MPLFVKLVLFAVGLILVLLGGGMVAIASAAKLPVFHIPIPIGGSTLVGASSLTIDIDVAAIIKALTGFVPHDQRGPTLLIGVGLILILAPWFIPAT